MKHVEFWMNMMWAGVWTIILLLAILVLMGIKLAVWFIMGFAVWYVFVFAHEAIRYKRMK